MLRQEPTRRQAGKGSYHRPANQNSCNEERKPNSRNVFWLPHMFLVSCVLSCSFSLSLTPLSLKQINKEKESFKMLKESSLGRMLFLDPSRRKHSLWMSENGAIFLWRDRASFQSSDKAPPWLTTSFTEPRQVWCYITWGTGMGVCFWASMLHIQFQWLFSRQLILPDGLKNQKES